MIDIKAKSNKEAEILLYEDIGEGFFGGKSGKEFAKELKSLDRVERINVRINSNGGSVFDGIAMYNMLVNHPAKIRTDVDGIAASIASVIAMAGDVVAMADNANLMIHKPWAPVGGNADEMRKMADTLDKVESSIVVAYQRHAAINEDQLRSAMADETWYTAQEAMEAGFIQDITSSQNIAAWIDPRSYPAYNHIPEHLQQPPRRDRSEGRVLELASMQAALKVQKL